MLDLHKRRIAFLVDRFELRVKFDQQYIEKLVQEFIDKIVSEISQLISEWREQFPDAPRLAEFIAKHQEDTVQAVKSIRSQRDMVEPYLLHVSDNEEGIMEDFDVEHDEETLETLEEDSHLALQHIDNEDTMFNIERELERLYDAKLEFDDDQTHALEEGEPYIVRDWVAHKLE